MAFTYSSTSISTDLAKVRLMLGDTDSDDPLLTDEEINYVLGRYDDVDRAAAECCRLVLASPKVARAIDRNGTGFSATRSQRFQHLKDLLDMLTSKARIITAATFTGASVSAQETRESDSDYVPAAFERSQHDYIDEDE